MSEVSEIKALLIGSIENLVRDLAPEGRRCGSYWIAKNPTRADRNAGSFWVLVKGSATGAWRDEATGEQGDVLNLIGYCMGHGDFKATLDWARAWLNLGRMSDDDRRRRVADADDRRRECERDDGERLEKNRKSAFGIYLAALKRQWGGSPADVYLRSRGVDVGQLGRRPGCLGWLPDALHRESGWRGPVMVAGMTGADGRLMAVHRTWLASDGLSKAPVSPQRKIWPSFAGAAIRMWRGDSGLSVDDAARHGLREALVLVEGVEDALSVAISAPKYRVWAAGSLGNLALQVMPECVDEVIVVADNDWGKPQAQQQFDAAIAALARQVDKVSVARAWVGKDANDLLRGVT